jgi:hypothetical protein
VDNENWEPNSFLDQFLKQKRQFHYPFFLCVKKSFLAFVSFDSLFWQNWMFSHPVCGWLFMDNFILEGEIEVGF